MSRTYGVSIGRHGACCSWLPTNLEGRRADSHRTCDPRSFTSKDALGFESVTGDWHCGRFVSIEAATVNLRAEEDARRQRNMPSQSRHMKRRHKTGVPNETRGLHGSSQRAPKLRAEITVLTAELGSNRSSAFRVGSAQGNS